ncbi:PcfJ domain-containing protein [Aquisphaera insulae]|uniref:PcfJ domain-containing protein n=1 Tax=Aquisphaera insulae TaxID=2712864 RepID=UPI0013EDE3C2|nr:PcfJ domain-containing protein [Aquisphaera insulae]
MPVKIAPREHAKALIDRSIRQTLASRWPGGPSEGIVQFLGEVRGRSDLLRPARLQGRIRDGWPDAIVTGLLALYAHRRHWFRPLRLWEPREANPLPLFSSLAHHLMACFPVPPVLLSAWFLGDDDPARRQQGWFRHAGQGKSLRDAGFPIRLSRRMAHEFAHAPARFPIRFALRWAQVIGLGGSDELARVVAATRLGRDFNHGAFWTSVIHVLINSPRLDPALVEPLVEYLQDQKFENRRVIIGEDTEVAFEPPQPDLSVKGRTAESLVRRAVEWRAERTEKQEPKRTRISWERSGIGEFLRQDEEGRIWTVRELLDSDTMAAEGKAMNHCVAEYTERCAQRRTTIWSIALETPEARQRHATVEVEPTGRDVIQAKARFNEDPDEACMAILMRWAAQEGLKMDREEADAEPVA